MILKEGVIQFIPKKGKLEVWYERVGAMTCYHTEQVSLSVNGSHVGTVYGEAYFSLLFQEAHISLEEGGVACLDLRGVACLDLKGGQK